MQNIIMDDLLRIAVARNASDLHIKVGRPPLLRINGKLYDMDYDPLDPRTARNLVYSLIRDEQQEEFENVWEFDFAYECEGAGRFRVNLHKDRGFIGASLRVISSRIPSLKELNMPEIFGELALLPSGLIILTGPTGCGKSTTLAAMIDVVNSQRDCHIVTIEDPVEYLHTHKKSIVTQREVGNDTKSFADALKRVLRQDPDVILVGEIRDTESAGMAITAAETGHLVLTTLHTVDAPQTIDRLVDMFMPNQQPQIRMQLSGTLRAVISQRLIPRIDIEGRIPAQEIMLGTPAIRANIRRGETHLLYSTIQTSKQTGMQTMNQSLRDLINSRKISRETAFDYTHNPDDLRQILGMSAGNDISSNKVK
ncbi:TPA: type IV pilus twitching motility protein PilT [bacterium]|mgnify:CR=1 FL=1|nr:type IV pilus twitching motility protein PilT [bacterium]